MRDLKLNISPPLARVRDLLNLFWIEHYGRFSERWLSGRKRTPGERVVAERLLLGSNPSLSVLLRSNTFVFELRSNFVLMKSEEERRCEATLDFYSTMAKQGKRQVCTQFISLEAFGES